MSKDTALTRDRILDAVSEQLELSGIAGLRLRDVAERLHVSVPSLYRFFADREAMIDAAYVREFSAQTLADLDEVRGAFDGASGAGDYANALRKVMVDLFADQARRSRWRKLAAIAATRHDPALLAQITSVQAEFNSRVAALYTLANDKGWLRVKVSPAALVCAMQGLAMAPLYAEISGDGIGSEALAQVVEAFHEAVTA